MTHLYQNILVTGVFAESLINYGENISLLIKIGGKVIVGDLSDEISLSEILKDFDAVVCVHKGNTVHQTIVNASKKYKRVKLIIAALWTMFNPDTMKEGENPIADVHRVTLEIMRKSNVPFIGILNGAFYEYALLSDFVGLNLPSNKVKLYGDRNQKFYTTSTLDIAKITPYILNDESKIAISKSSGYATVALKTQRSVYFRDTVYTEPTNEIDYPNVKFQSIEEFLKNHLQK
eukprot:gene882-9793_t